MNSMLRQLCYAVSAARQKSISEATSRLLVSQFGEDGRDILQSHRFLLNPRLVWRQ